MTVTITINLPESLVAPVQRLGEATARNISEVLVDTLEIILPTFNNLSEISLHSEISQLSNQAESNSDGVISSVVFPGLWLDKAALLAGNLAKVIEVLQQGLASQEHEDFVQQLAK